MSAETLREIKKQFMAFRNGVVADTLRSAGMDCYHVIFGLNLPQLTQIAAPLKELPADERRELATALWEDRHVRESRLLAMYLLGTLDLSREEALALMAGALTREEAEILCLRVLRSLPYAAELLEDTSVSDPLQAHLQLMLGKHLA